MRGSRAGRSRGGGNGSGSGSGSGGGNGGGSGNGNGNGNGVGFRESDFRFRTRVSDFGRGVRTRSRPGIRCGYRYGYGYGYGYRYRYCCGHRSPPRAPKPLDGASLVYMLATMMTQPALRGLAAIPAVRRLIELALDEDLGRGDVTSSITVGPDGPMVIADMSTREPIVAFGIDIASAVFALVDPRIELELHCADGARLERGALLLTARGPAHGVLAAERTALNFAQRLSGVATLSRRYADLVAAVNNGKTRVVDTRKTTPGFRVLEKAAVLAGGCANHRFDLGSGVLIKDNHIAACGSVRAAVEAAKARAPHPLRIEVEVTNLGELDEALNAGAEIVLLDNMTPSQVEVAAARAHGRNTLVEVSGGVTLATVADYARAGADLISVGALTHSAPAVDIGLDVRT